VSRETVDALLRQVFDKEPMHPAHHYIIHLWDDSKPARALTSAAKCGQSTPTIAHMWHMPGHTFSKADREVDAAWQQEAATRVDHAYMIRTQILPDQIHNYAHNTEWLIRTWNQLGRAGDSVGLAKNFIEIPRHPTWNPLDKKNDSASFGRTRLLETLLKFEQWDEVLALDGSPWLDITPNPSYEANRLRAMGVAAFFKDDKAKLRKLVAAVSALKGKPEPASDVKKTETVTPVARTPDKPAETAKTEEIKKAITPATAKSATPAKTTAKPSTNAIVDNAIAELQALLAMSEGKTPEEVQKLLDAAKDTPKERQVRYQLKLGKMDKAATLAGQLPNDAPGLALRVDALLQCGKTEDAKKQFEKTRTTAALLDPGLPMSGRLDAIAVQLGVGAAWRKPEPPHADSGVRPELDSLGPIHWHPWRAAEFTLPDARGKEVSLKDYAGKPVVVLFYLGSTCSHCMEQLKAFTSMAKEYEAAGIQIVAIGSEDPMGLTATSNTCDAKSGAPFPLLSDPELNIFKQWRCHDDFEKSPLHGAFLVDGKGQVRWADISPEPLRDAKFLLGEAKRLLKF
jgi:peroxiredoxin